MQYRELILGGPGCGKTTRLLDIVSQHLKRGVKPSEIAYVAFTKKAAAEARHRAYQQFGFHEKELPYFRTLHSFAFRELGLRSDQLMQDEHYDELGDALKVQFGKVEDDFGIISEQRERGSQWYHIEQQARLRCMDLRKMCLMDGRHGFLQVKYYQDSLKLFKEAREVYDYTDILEVWLERMHPLPVKVLIVDEAQDLSPLQWKIVDRMSSGVDSIYYAGDDDQAIYEWAGADINHFLNLGVHTTVLPLSHRLPRQVFARCDRIAKKIKHRYAKNWQPAERDGAVVTIGSPEAAPVGTGQWMVLARNHYQLEGVAAFFKSKGHVFMFSGKSSIGTPDALALRAWLRNQHNEYVCFSDVKRILSRFYKSKFRGGKSSIFAMQDDALIERSELASTYGIDLNESWENNLVLKVDERSYLKTVLSHKIDLEEAPSVKISTIHAVKGGEADNVMVLPDMSAACYGSYVTRPDSESRVFYVACSRAKERLVLCHPQGSNYFPL